MEELSCCDAHQQHGVQLLQPTQQKARHAIMGLNRGDFMQLLTSHIQISASPEHPAQGVTPLACEHV
jgi:hypothetical protein